jgi:hypothetical protein
MARKYQMTRKYAHLYKTLYGIVAALTFFLLLLPALRLMPIDAQLTPTADISREQGLDARIHEFLTSLRRGNHTSALDELLQPPSPYSSPNAESQVTDLRKEVEKAGKQFGAILNWERYEAKQIGSDIILVRYILKYEQHPVMWTFLFYRKPSSTLSMTSPSTWVLIQLYFDTNFSERQ